MIREVDVHRVRKPTASETEHFRKVIYERHREEIQERCAKRKAENWAASKYNKES